LVAVKLPERPLVDELRFPLLFSLIDATSKATSTDVVIGACTASASQTIPDTKIVFMSHMIDHQPNL
jgi:hypothetical protein